MKISDYLFQISYNNLKCEIYEILKYQNLELQNPSKFNLKLKIH